MQSYIKILSLKPEGAKKHTSNKKIHDFHDFCVRFRGKIANFVVMKVIYNRFIPFGSFHGLNLFGTIFVQRRWGKMDPHELNHETIHTLQQWEMTYVGFYLWYCVEYLVRLVQYRFKTEKAYYNISFEREAYANERNQHYVSQRRPMAWVNYLRKSS